MTNKIIGVMIMLVIGLALLPVVFTFANNLTADAIVTPATPAGILNGTSLGALVNLLPVIYVIILLAGAVGFIVTSKQ